MKGRWLLGQSIEEIAPRLFALIPTQCANNNDAMTNQQWIQNIQGSQSCTISPLEPLGVDVQTGLPDSHIWRLCSSSQWSLGTARPPSSRKLPHVARMKAINHLFISCFRPAILVCYRASFWCCGSVHSQWIPPLMVGRVMLLIWTLPPSSKASTHNLVIIMGAWGIWTHRNNCVLSGAQPNFQGLVPNFQPENKRLSSMDRVILLFFHSWAQYVIVWSRGWVLCGVCVVRVL